MLRGRLSIEPLANRVGTRGIGVHACPPLDLPRDIHSALPGAAALYSWKRWMTQSTNR